MWARKITETCTVDGVATEIEYTDVNDSWYDMLLEGVGGLLFMTLCLTVIAITIPFMVTKAAYQQYRYQNTPLPPDKVRERSHF